MKPDGYEILHVVGNTDIWGFEFGLSGAMAKQGTKGQDKESDDAKKASDDKISAAATISLSATGSRKAPNAEVWFKARAR